MSFLVIVLLRLAVAAFCLLTAAYGVLNCSAFAFDMFIRPQLFPRIGQFVAWHHLWLAGAYLLSVLSVWPELDWRRTRDRRGRAAHWLALGYAVAFGGVVSWQQASPHLPTLWNDHRALPTTLAALVPLVWLAAIDYLSVGKRTILDENAAWRPIGQRRLLLTSAGVAVYLWLVHVARALTRSDLGGGVTVWIVTGLWTLTLTLATFALVYTVGWLIESVAALTRARRTAERLLLVGVAAAVVAVFLRRIVFPTLSLQTFDGWVIAACAGAAVAIGWSGVARRRVASVARTGAVASGGREGTIAAAGALLVAPLSLLALGLAERVDWAFVGQRFIVVSAWALTFGFALRATRALVWNERAASAFSPWRVVVPPIVVLLAVLLVPRAASTLASAKGDGRFEPTVAFERHAAADVAFQLVSNLFVARKGFDAEYYRFLHTEANFSGVASVTVPVVDLATPLAPARRQRPDIFVIALDSLRRDYLSPYNAAVMFTPSIAGLAADGFVFENAFTRHGGTELAIPSIWAGGMLVRQVRVRGFERVNAFEKLVNTEGYRILINDFTIAQNILPSTPVTHLNPGVPSADTDLCGNLEGLQSELDARGAGGPPVFGYLSPMNVHILNTQRNGQRSLDGDYPGFFAPYASRLRRLDRCLGQFLSYLKRTGRYDESIIVITSDHGDSLGENGHWGHATWLPPEVVRIPLIVKIPASVRSTVTTDLARLAFSTDIAPTLYALLGHSVRDLGPLFGAPLFVPTEDGLPDRRRGSFLLTASYGATYGLLRRNGRGLYVTDLVERREFAYDLSHGVVGAETTVDHGLRQVNQREIRSQVAEIARFFNVTR